MGTRQLPNNKEIISLIRSIRDGAMGSDVSLGNILRLCMRLGKLLGNEELVKWARLEATGYQNADDLPDYRKMPCESRGDFYGPSGSGFKNAHIPNGIIEESHREFLCKVYMFEAVSELESLANDGDTDDNLLKIEWPGDVIALYQKKEIYSGGLVIMSAWRVMTKQKLIGVLEVIRTRVLDFILEIEEELDLQNITDDETPEISRPQPEKVQQIFNNTIYGGNVAVGNNTDFTQNLINVQKGDINSLKKYLEQIGLKEKEIEELEQAIKEDGMQKEKLGSSVSSWLAKAAMMGVRGTWSVASNVAGSLIASALMRYYGIPTA